ncbi:MAG: hypothetical protein V4555_04230 [Acidobacteriota bacterium]
MANLSYREKCLYGALVADLAVFVPYFVLMHTRHASLSFIAGSITVLIAAQIVLQGAVAVFSRNRLKDERDQLILLRGYRAGYVTVLSLMLGGMLMLWMSGQGPGKNPDHFGLHFLSVFFLILMIGELVKTITQLVTYRRAM